MILVTSSTKAGSWSIRGEQLGAAIGALVAAEASAEQIAAADLVIVVKRASVGLLERLRRAGKRPVVDVVDPWPQPAGNLWAARQTVSWLKAYVEGYNPAGAVCTTAAMREAMPPGVPALVLPHHGRPGQPLNPIRPHVGCVGYEGSVRYLDGWRSRIEAECARRRWRFVVNQMPLASVDIVVAFRGGSWRGWPTDHLKSGIKLANAQATGTPFIGLPEDGYREIDNGGALWIDQPDELAWSFDLLTPFNERQRRAAILRAGAPRLEVIAKEYRSWLDTLKS